MREQVIQKIKGTIFLNKTFDELVHLIRKTQKSYLTPNGVIATFTGERTSRSSKDRYLVYDNNTQDKISWGEYNQPISKEIFDQIKEEIENYLFYREVYICDCIAGQDDSDRMDMTVFSELPSQALFCKIMFRDVVDLKIKDFHSQYTVLSAPNLNLDKKKYGIHSNAFIGIDFTRKIIIIAGTGYTCEIKKAMFSFYNYEKPQKNILTMHSSANCDKFGKNTAIFFGLSGTGKTTLSNAKDRFVVADDQICWNENGVFNIEDGCYAKVFELTKESDPEIYNAIKYGAMIENVPQKANGEPDYTNCFITENMRTAYPLTNLENVMIAGKAESPQNIFFLTADSTGVFPPISKLKPDQIIYYFLNGFTSKMAGLEGDTPEPVWTFSACFGAPFMPLDVYTYANLLEKKVRDTNCNVWLVNTGWTGGRYGNGTRIKLKDTKTLVAQAINTGFKEVDFIREPYFNLSVPKDCPNISDPNILLPYKTWKKLKDYETMAKKVKQAFHKNCKKNNIKDIYTN